MARTLVRVGGVAASILVGALAAVGCSGSDPVVATTTPSSAPNPVPISGGTLSVTADGDYLVMSDPDVDRILVFAVDGMQPVAELKLEPGDEPGRVIEGGEGLMHVALRRGGGIATVDLSSMSLERRDACPAPRGIAYDPASDNIHVACASGELVTMPAASGQPTRTLHLDLDLRDVVVQGNHLLISRFKSAELLILDSDGNEIDRKRPGFYRQEARQVDYEPAVAWRMVPLQEAKSGSVAIVHQRGQVDPIGGSGTPATVYYGSNCADVILHSAVTVFTGQDTGSEDESPVSDPLVNVGGIGAVVLPVDIAAAPDGFTLAVAGAGSEMVVQTNTQTVRSMDVTDLCDTSGQLITPVAGEPMALDYGPDGALYVQTRQPAKIHKIVGGSVVEKFEIPGKRQRHVGHAMFHRRATEFAGIACASCHPEGGEDGRVWKFATSGDRRTQTMAGGVLDTAPLHWSGDLDGLGALMDEVFVSRMGGQLPPPDRLEELGNWMNEIEHIPSGPPNDEAATQRGRELFDSAAVGCANCHNGAKFTDNTTVNVGTGEPLQVPSLNGIKHRAPFMHTGCAKTLRDRFNPECGGGDAHGKTSHLSEAELDDLIAYLEAL